MNRRTKIFFGVVVLLLIVGGATLFVFDNTKSSRAAEYNPQINPADFTTEITNKYFALPVGKKLTYETTEQGSVTERIEIEILPETVTIEGVETVVYLDKEYKNGQLVEETRDYLAQHNNGDVWYFGEDVDNYSNGILLNHSGSFLHGKDGAKAGIWMKAEQRPEAGILRWSRGRHAGHRRYRRDCLHQVRHVHRLRQGLRLDAA